MIVSHDWLRAFVPHGRTAAEIGQVLSTHVATLEGMEALRTDLAPFVIGQVVHTERIPETRLSFNRVDDGSGQLLEVVCGAPNVELGAKYPLARVGTVIPGKGGITIERRKIRGFTSAGMLCSAQELGLGEDADGIMTLDTDAAPGTPLLDIMPTGDVRLELDVLANRPDLLSQLGVAREASALTETPMTLPPELRDLAPAPAAAGGAREASAGGATIRIEDAEGCPRFTAAVIRGVRVGPSPEWLVQRLAGVGARSINNVVDVTNYLLHGLGQPAHAYDLATLSGATLVARRARAGEALTTLDGHARTLDGESLVIADAERAQGIAGVMGGQESEVSERTTDVLLEVALFDPRRVRTSRKRAGVSSDASYRFERGVDRGATLERLAQAAGLIVAVAGGTVEAVLDVGEAPTALPPVRLRAARIARLLGAPIPDADVERLLAAIGFRIEREAGGETAWTVTPPSWRQDVTREVDLIEEVVRLVGFDALPDELRPFRTGTVPDDPMHIVTHRVRDALVAQGLLEAKPLPFVRGEDTTHVRVGNPLAEDEPHLRMRVLDSLRARAEYNLSRMHGNVRLFESGGVFAVGANGQPAERWHVAALVMGDRRPPHFTEPKPPAFDAWDAKGIAEIAAAAAFPGAAIALVPAPDESGRLWTVQADGHPVGEVAQLALDAPVWATPAFGVELTLSTVASTPVAARGARLGAAPSTPPAAPHVRARALPSTPAAELDLALLVPDAVAAADVERVLRAAGGELLERVDLFDEFRGGDVPAGSRSLAWRLTLRDPSRTLRDKEVEGRRQKLLKALDGELGVRPRAG
ncbi:MAG: phenylalanine--tRNA ligase subunit beta [Gemmatirosa sp.]